MSSNYPPDEPERTVRPRRPSSTYRHIIVIDRGEVLVERTGQVHRLADLPAILGAEKSSILVAQGGWENIMQMLIDAWGKHPRFRYRMTPRRTRTYADGEVIAETTTDAIVNYVGFAKDKDNHHTQACYHYPLDPIHFCRAGIDELYPHDPTPTDTPRTEMLLRWAQQVRAWCDKNQLQVRPSAGGLAAQLLRDPRFYPEPRRKAPRLINTTTRPQLPGNYYHLHAMPGKTYRGIYLDMENAHHNMATLIQFPDANTLHGYGNYMDPDHITKRPLGTGTSGILEHPGIFDVTISTPLPRSQDFPPPFLMRSSNYRCWIYSNELSMLAEFGAVIERVHAAFISDGYERHGLNDYARFAIKELREEHASRPWLKPTLHATYGMLAARPMAFETGYSHSNGGTPGEYHIGRYSFPVRIHNGKGEPEPRVTNVIHRGMIEAQVRREVLETARLLTQADGEEVLSIYADSLIIRDRQRDLKLLAAPWRVKEQLTNLRFLDATHFTSDQLTRMPGLPKTMSEARRRDLQAWQDARKSAKITLSRAHQRARKTPT